MAREEKSSETPRGRDRAKDAGAGDVHGVKGEGNPEADRRYREGAKGFAESGRVEDAAREARESVEEEARTERVPEPSGRERGPLERGR